MPIIVREMLAEDADAVNLLSAQLGYPLCPPQTFENITASYRVRTTLLVWHSIKQSCWMDRRRADNYDRSNATL